MKNFGKRRRDTGSVLMEFILVMPILLFLIFGLLQFSLIWMARLMTHYAAYSAARAAIVYPEADRARMAQLAAEIAISKSQVPGLEKWFGIEGPEPEKIGSRVGVTCEDMLGSDGSGIRAIKATVTFRYPLMIPYAGSIIGYMAAGNPGSWQPAGYEPDASQWESFAAGGTIGGFRTIDLTESCIMPYLWNTELLPRAGSDLPPSGYPRQGGD